MNFLQQSISRRTFFYRTAQLTVVLGLWPLHRVSAAPVVNTAGGYGQGPYGQGAYPARIGQRVIDGGGQGIHPPQTVNSIYLPLVTKGE